MTSQKSSPRGAGAAGATPTSPPPPGRPPGFAKPGTPGEELEVQLELKLLADVGLVGFPNVGKSTLVSVVSEAKPNIANYHFTTLSPVLGVVRLEAGRSFVMADIPGLIEGAWQGVGLGHQFLRHVERCRLLVHVVDVAGSEGRDPKEDFRVINEELQKFNPELSQRPMLVAGNKCDLATDQQVADFQAFVEAQGYQFFPIMAPIRHGVDELLNAISAALAKLPPIRQFAPRGPGPGAGGDPPAGPGGGHPAGRGVLRQGPLAAEDHEHHRLRRDRVPPVLPAGAHPDGRHRRPAGRRLPGGGTR